jgi:hypothetical protein
VGFESVPESIAFAESAKHVREFVHQRSSPNVATEATGVAGGLERRELHSLEQSYPDPIPTSRRTMLENGQIAVISGYSRTSRFDKSPTLVHP